MALTLELPAPLEDELTRDAKREDVSPERHATLLLSLATAFLKESRPTPFKNALRVLLSSRSLDADRVASLIEDLLTVCERYQIDPLSDREIGMGDDFDLTVSGQSPLESLVQRAGRFPRRRPSARGSCANLGLSSERFAEEKQEESAREDRGRA